MNIEISEKLFNYLEDVSGITSLTENQRLVSDLHLNSKEIIDLAIFFYGIAGKKIAFGKDLSIKEILDMCEWAIFLKSLWYQTDITVLSEIYLTVQMISLGYGVCHLAIF